MRKNSEYVVIWLCCILFGACYASFLKYCGVEDYIVTTILAAIGTVVTIKTIDLVTSLWVKVVTNRVKRNR